MQPLDPNDPMWKVLGRSHPVNVRGNFVQNVVREARHTQQGSRLAAWWMDFRQELALRITRQGAARFAVAAAVAMVVLGVIGFGLREFRIENKSTGDSFVMASKSAQGVVRSSTGESVANVPGQPEVETEWENMAQMSALLAVEDTSVLSDSEIASILY